MAASASPSTPSSFNVTQARRDTPGCENVLHLNNAGAALMPRPVLETMVNHLRLEAMNGGYEAAAQEADRLERVYQLIAQLLNAQPDEIALAENATRAWDMAFYAIPLKAGDRILTSRVEYGSNFIALLHRAKQVGAIIETIPSDESGQVSLTALAQMIDTKVKVIAITHVPTNGGLVNPAQEIGRIARTVGAFYLLDACQSAGQLPLDVRQIDCDMLSATGRKYLRGPRGTGFLYVQRSIIEYLEPPLLDHHAAEWIQADQYRIRPDARRFESWESNIAARLGLGRAVEYALGWGMDNIWRRIEYLADTLRGYLRTIPGVQVQDLGQVQCGLVTFTVTTHSPEAVKAALSQRKINVSVSNLASTRLDMERRGLQSVVRASVHYYNTKAELQHFCRVLAGVMRLGR
jgi:selenocysteine lyase/cysteine desulfurase